MVAPPNRTELVDTQPNPSNGVFKGGIGKLYDYVTLLLGTSGDAADARNALGAVGTSGAETIDDVKTFLQSPMVPTPVEDDDAANKGYVDGQIPSQTGHSGKALVTNGTDKSWGHPAQLSTASGAAPSYGARAWVDFNGTNNVIRASGNVSSITRHSTGEYTINFAAPMQDNNYGIVGFARSDTDVATFGAHVTTPLSASKLAGSCRISTCFTGTSTGRIDVPEACVTIYR